MPPTWRDHLVDEGDGTMRLQAHGMMKVDARLVTDAQHMQPHASYPGPAHLVTYDSLPAIRAEAWAIAD